MVDGSALLLLSRRGNQGSGSPSKTPLQGRACRCRWETFLPLEVPIFFFFFFFSFIFMILILFFLPFF